MAMIFINRNRQSLGQFNPQEVADGLQSGQFLPTDLAWQEPMESWQPLASFSNLPAPTPAGAQRVAPLTANQPDPVHDAPAVIEPAWERDDSAGFFARMIETVKQVFTKPTETFKAMPCEGGYGKPLKFYILITWATSAVAIMYQAAASLINPAMFVGEEAKNMPSWALLGIFGVVIVLMPVFLLIGSFVSAGLMHVALLVVGGAKKPFETTFRAIAYAQGATSALQLLPICGGTIYSIASLVYTVIALKESHRTDLWRPIVAIVLLLLVFCGIIFGLVAFGAGMAGTLVNQAR